MNLCVGDLVRRQGLPKGHPATHNVLRVVEVGSSTDNGGRVKPAVRCVHLDSEPGSNGYWYLLCEVQPK